MQELHERYAAVNDVEVIAVHYDDNYGKYDSARAYFRSKDYTIPVIEDGTAIRKRYKVKSIPTMILVDQSGTVAFSHSGRLNAAGRDEMIEQIERLRTGG